MDFGRQKVRTQLIIKRGALILNIICTQIHEIASPKKFAGLHRLATSKLVS